MGTLHVLGLPWDLAAFVLLLPGDQTAWQLPARQADLGHGARSGPGEWAGGRGQCRAQYCLGGGAGLVVVVTEGWGRPVG